MAVPPWRSRALSSQRCPPSAIELAHASAEQGRSRWHLCAIAASGLLASQRRLGPPSGERGEGQLPEVFGVSLCEGVGHEFPGVLARSAGGRQTRGPSRSSS